MKTTGEFCVHTLSNGDLTLGAFARMVATVLTQKESKMCGCHPSVFQIIRRAVTRLEMHLFKRTILPRGNHFIQSFGKLENAYWHGTVWTHPLDPCAEVERRQAQILIHYEENNH